jgi:hypothetical protein
MCTTQSQTRICHMCGEVKPHSDFTVVKKTGKPFFNCKECEIIRSREYARTKEGLVSRIYKNQKVNSKKRGYSIPSYTRLELQEWLFSQEKFHHIYNIWKASGFDKLLVPSVDRLDDYMPYSFSNIQLMTFKENFDKHKHDMINGVNNKQNKSVLQYSKQGEFISEYHSLSEAVRIVGGSTSDLSKVCKGLRKTSRGFIWKYKEK